MKYGKLDIKLPSIEKQITALKEKLSQNEITQETFNKKVEELKKGLLNFIAVTNGAYTAPSKYKGRKASKLALQREKGVLERIKNYLAAQQEQSSLKEKETSTKESLPKEENS